MLNYPVTGSGKYGGSRANFGSALTASLQALP